MSGDEPAAGGVDEPAPASSPGCLHVVATPIGNLEDLSPRACRVLREVALIAAEDTRRVRPLLQSAGSKVRTVSLHEHNEAQRVSLVLEALATGKDVALVSDAGTPLINDPGFNLVQAVQGAGYRVLPVPGASAVTAALSVAGLPTDRFCFEGFLPSRDGARRTRLEVLASEPRTMVFFEAPHRVEATVAAMASVFGGAREIVLARELTKKFESVRRLPLVDALPWLRGDADRRRGEFVLIVQGSADDARDTPDPTGLLRVLLQELPPARAARAAAQLTGISRQQLYRRALQLADDC